MTPGYKRYRHAWLLTLCNHECFLLRGIPATALHSGYDFDSLHLGYSFALGLCLGLRFYQGVRFNWGLLQEYISSKLVLWADKHGIRLEHIQPGNPQQNAYVERYNRTVRYDWLGHYLFESIAEVQEHATRWVWIYNHERPNMALGGITPKPKLALVA